MFETLKNAFKNKDVRRKLLITLALLFIYRLGCWIPIPGINPTAFSSNTTDGLLGLLNGITGSALENGALFAIGITPYINASIILQLLTVAFPRLQEMQKQGDEGRKKITQITRYVAIVLAVVQSIGIIVTYDKQGGIVATLGSKWVSYIVVSLLLTSGSAFVMWLAEKITE